MKKHPERHCSLIGLLAVVGGLAIWVLLTGMLAGPNGNSLRDDMFQSSRSELPQLRSVEPATEEMEGAQCEYVVENTSASLRAIGASGVSLSAESSDNLPRPAATIDRPPVRVIRDPNPTFSAVTVDSKRDEVVLQDENTFQIMVYDRRSNTPASAAMTEPKRVIAGLNTKVEFNCAVYVDSESGDIYAVNNDTLDTMTVFSRNARGNAKPDRELHTPHRTYGIAVDEQTEELYLTVQQPPEVVVYRKQASGNEKPVRRIWGNHTHLEDPHGIAIDTKNNLMFVSNHGNVSDYRDNATAETPEADAVQPGSGKYDPPSITIYPLKSEGDFAPIRIITGPKTGLNWPAHIDVDPEHGEIYVANDVGNSVLVFRTTDNGDVAPIRVVKGPRTGLRNPVGIYLDKKNDELAVASMGNHSATFYPRTADGDTAPLRTIRAAPRGFPALQIGNPGAVAFDSKRNEILVPN